MVGLTIVSLSCVPHQTVNHPLHHWNVLDQFLHLQSYSGEHCRHMVCMYICSFVRSQQKAYSAWLKHSASVVIDSAMNLLTISSLDMYVHM